MLANILTTVVLPVKDQAAVPLMITLAALASVPIRVILPVYAPAASV